MEIINIDFYNFRNGVNNEKATIIINFLKNIMGAHIQYLDEDEVSILFD